MISEYSVDVIKQLEGIYREAELYRPMRITHYEKGTELFYDVRGVSSGNKARVHLIIDKFVGGGFAGQVYRIKILDIFSDSGPVEGLSPEKMYAMKILVPPSSFSCLFRNALYWIGFQGPFQLQVNPAAARAGAIWQKLIRRGAKVRFGDENSVVDIYATFIDEQIGSCGELSEWIDGRTWRLEVDERMDLLKKWRKGKPVHSDSLGSPEFRGKYEFMHKFVELLHDMGGHEFARQYEWSTCKSQPNCLRRNNFESAPYEGLVAVDFRAGLVLLPFLPMSPGDFKLIGSGVKRGSLVQFDRGDLDKLGRFMDTHTREFDDMHKMLDELKASEDVYRKSVPDVTHNHISLLYKKSLWSTIFKSSVKGWKICNLVDESSEKKLHESSLLTFLLYLIGIIPIIGNFFIKLWGHSGWRKHYGSMLTSWNYFRRSLKGKVAERLIGWHRAGRVDSEKAINLSNSVMKFFYHIPLSLLPVGLHRLFTDLRYAKERLAYIIVRPVRLYFNSELREQWLFDMVQDGKDKHLLSNEDAETILSQIKEPFIQKYLKSLAVHVCTLPVTQVVSLAIAMIYVIMHPEMPRAQSWAIGLGIIALFQVMPISPGSLVRGLYVLLLVIRERNFKDYNIAVFLGFFKYIGYLAFPIQMGYRYPALARFMAAYWATEAVHVVPVFGERGALLEHGIFRLFYNWPLTIRRRMTERAKIRALMKPRYWHIVLCGLAALGILTFTDYSIIKSTGDLPSIKDIWLIGLLVPIFCGAFATLYAKGASFSKRIIGSALCGSITGLCHGILMAVISTGTPFSFGETAVNSLWWIFILTVFSTIGTIMTELILPEPDENMEMAKVSEN